MLLMFSAVSDIQDFGDAASLAGDTVFFVEYVDL
jgi:hypothetical protein